MFGVLFEPQMFGVLCEPISKQPDLVWGQKAFLCGDLKNGEKLGMGGAVRKEMEAHSRKKEQLVLISKVGRSVLDTVCLRSVKVAGG